MVEERLRAGGRPFRQDRLVVRTPDPELDAQIARAAEALGAVAESHAWTALAALAVGEFEAPRRLLRALGDRQDGAGRIVVENEPGIGDGLDPTVLYLFLSARHLLWTGDLAFACAHWERVRRACHAALEGGAAVPQTILGELSAAAESAGDGALAEELRRRVPAARLARLRTPARASAEASARQVLLSPGDRDPASPWGSVLEELGRKQTDPSVDPATAAALLAASFVHGILGVEPDAPRGRLVLRPAIPPSWSHLEVLRLQLGDAAVSLRYHRDDTVHRFHIEQESGAVPLRLIFEPALPAPALAGARVDGQEASLDPRSVGRIVLVPVQIVLDHERVVELQTGT
ncbi:MAG TPA: hypothetical protein VIL13_01435 [Longimicrobiales bacterium]